VQQVRVAMLICGICSVAEAQNLIDPSTAHRLEESLSPDSALNCDFLKIDPTLSYQLQMQFGYFVSLPLVQLPVKAHDLWALLRVTPREVVGAQPVYFLHHYELPPVLASQFAAEFWGAVRAGDGAYDVAVSVFDEQHRSCRAEWQVHVNPTREDRAGMVGMPVHTVAEVTSGESQGSHRPTASVGRLTILLHVTPSEPGHVVLSDSDIQMLTDALAAVMETVSAREVRLAMFSLAGQKEFLRQNQFTLHDIDRAADALSKAEEATVDLHALVTAQTALTMLGGLLSRELTDAAPPDLIIFLGPAGLSADSISTKSVLAERRVLPPIFYIQCASRVQFRRSYYLDHGIELSPPGLPSYRPESPLANSRANARPFPKTEVRPEPAPGANSNEFNTIRFTVKALKGKTFLVWRPLDFAKALQEIVSAINRQGR
jgi:hypothetical protein